MHPKKVERPRFAKAALCSDCERIESSTHITVPVGSVADKQTGAEREHFEH
jgi:hypothetical protein